MRQECHLKSLKPYMIISTINTHTHTHTHTHTVLVESLKSQTKFTFPGLPWLSLQPSTLVFPCLWDSNSNQSCWFCIVNYMLWFSDDNVVYPFAVWHFSRRIKPVAGWSWYLVGQQLDWVAPLPHSHGSLQECTGVFMSYALLDVFCNPSQLALRELSIGSLKLIGLKSLNLPERGAATVSAVLLL